MIDKMIRCKNLDVTNKIDCLHQWFDKCPPQGRLKHWKDGKSAKETAKHWLHTIPFHFKEILNSFNLKFLICSPEFVSKLDEYKGNARNHDLLIVAKNNYKNKVVIAIESKADEEFGDTISETIVEAESRFQQNPESNGLRRIEDLRLAVFGVIQDEQLNLRYQLLTAVAGTLAEAKKQKAKKAIFLVQTFVSDEINKKDHQRNQDDLNAFLNYLSKGEISELKEGELVGPFSVPGNMFIPHDIELWIGKYQIEI
jgi:hypothetical protein